MGQAYRIDAGRAIQILDLSLRRIRPDCVLVPQGHSIGKDYV
jgi:hypothetical protein